MKRLKLAYRLLFLVAFASLLPTCIDPVVFDRRQEDDLLVVDGKVSLQDTIQTLTLVRNSVVGRRARFPAETNAVVSLIENDKIVGIYVEEASGVYKIDNFKPKIGNSYAIDIQLQNGDHYTSLPETMPRPVPIDSAYFNFDNLRTLTLYSTIKIPEQGDALYLHWQVRHVYQRTDMICGFSDQMDVCYYELDRGLDNQFVALLDASELKPGTAIEAQVAKATVVDTIFGEITYFTVFQESITPATYRYWQKVDNLLTQTGSIFDAPPGQVRGNIYKVDDANALVLGVFYAAADAIAYVRTDPSDFLPLRLNPYCGTANTPRSPFPFPECCFCTFGIPRPDYW